MVKDETNDFFIENKTGSNSTSPDVASKWIGVAEKGIGLLETLISMRQAREGGSGGNATAKYEKGLAQGQAMAQAQAPQIVEVIKTPDFIFKSEEATDYLMGAMEKLDKNKTIGAYIEDELKELKESGILKTLVEKFLQNFIEVKNG